MRALMVAGELEEVRRGGWDEGVCRVRSVKNGLAAKRLSCSAACKESATQEQRNGPLPQSKVSKEAFRGSDDSRLHGHLPL